MPPGRRRYCCASILLALAAGGISYGLLQEHLTGSSGPFVDWGYWLRNLYKNVAGNRLIFEERLQQDQNNEASINTHLSRNTYFYSEGNLIVAKSNGKNQVVF